MEEEETKIYFVTKNIHKFHEISNLLSKTSINYTLEQKKIETAEIQATSIKEVALFKLNSVKGKIYGSYFVEDAGFFVDTPLNGFPGVYSSYVMKTIGNNGIIKLIDNFDETQAHFTSIIAFYFKPLAKNLFFEGNVYGKISKTLRGSGGFGFDPIFIPDIKPNKTFAELTTEEKNEISHRGKAWSKFIKFLEDYK